MNNAVYGKTMENVRKYQDVKLLPLRKESDEQTFIKKSANLHSNMLAKLAII